MRRLGSMVPRFDVYAYSPSHKQRLGTWPGFGFTVLMAVLVTSSMAFIVYSYVTTPFDLSESVVDADKHFILQPESKPPFPEVLVGFVDDNANFFTNNNIFEISFAQLLPLSSGEEQYFNIPTRECGFLLGDEEESRVNASCPQFGNLNETISQSGKPEHAFIPTDGRKGATVPCLQGTELDTKYMNLEAKVELNIANLRMSNKTLEDIYNGAIFYGIRADSYDLGGTTLRDSMANRLSHKFRFWTISVRQFLQTNAILELGIRSIQKGSFLMDFNIFEDEFFDIYVREQDQTAMDIEMIRIPTINLSGLLPANSLNSEVPDILPLAHITIKFSQDFQHVQMSPFSTLGGILGALGGLSSLFIFVIGIPAVYINQLLFSRKLQNAQTMGLLDENMFNRDGTLRIDRTNEVVEVLRRSNIKATGKAKRLCVTNVTDGSNYEDSFSYENNQSHTAIEAAQP